MADATVALMILTVCVAWFCICEQQLQKQKQRASQEIYISRIGKEAADRYYDSHQPVTEQRGKYTVWAMTDKVVVMEGAKTRLLITKQ